MPTCPQGRLTGWCGYCYDGRQGRAFHKGHFGYVHVEGRKWSQRMSLLKRSAKVTEVSPPALPSGTTGVKSCLPALAEFLTLNRWEDGAKRVLGTISLFWQDGYFKSWVNDKDACRSACVSAPTFDDVLLLIEQRLLDDSLEWRVDHAERKRRGKN